MIIRICSDCLDSFEVQAKSHRRYCLLCCRARAVRWKMANIGRFKRYQLKHRLVMYGITVEQYVQMWHAQSGKCAICKQQTNLVIDHNHQTDTVRGLLCQHCNRGLGYFKDNHLILETAASYVQGAL